ncbi:MAG: hypothetical protein WDM76_11570 [Limisphaerales bacterium]
MTLINEIGELLPNAVDGLKALKEKGYSLTLWSYAGEDYARLTAKKHGITNLFDGYATKPDLVIDDDAEALSQLPVIDPQISKNWIRTSQKAIDLVETIDSRSQWRDVPLWLQRMARDRYNVGVQSAVAIWRQRETYIRWPKEKRILSQDWVRHPDGSKKDCYDYPPNLAKEITQAGFKVDGRNNGPAILSFLLAGGDRPRRPYPSRWGWTIHHIYDGQHPTPRFSQRRVPHAASDSKLFTDSRGLVAIHPVVDYIVMHEPLLAWLLRWEAFNRFGFDPMNVFIPE